MNAKMMKNPHSNMKLSYIVPVYNVEAYLVRCVDSIIKQNIDDYEIILIDDGSTDKSGQICNELGESNDTIRVIHQCNKGLSGARNVGIKLARGDYILFVDSDDWLNNYTVHRIYNTAIKENLDVGVADFRYVHDNGFVESNYKKPIHLNNPIDGKQFFLRSMKAYSSLKAVWKSIYRRRFLLDNDLFFHEGYNHEDEEWTPRVYIFAKRIKDIPVTFYNYFIRDDSISKNKSTFEKNALDLIHNCYRLRDLSNQLDKGELRNCLQDRTVNLYLSAVFKGKLIYSRHTMAVNASFFDQMYMERKTKSKARLFCLNPHIYYYSNYISKKIAIILLQQR